MRAIAVRPSVNSETISYYGITLLPTLICFYRQKNQGRPRAASVLNRPFFLPFISFRCPLPGLGPRRGFLDRRPLLFAAADKTQRIRGVKGELAHRGLTGGAQGDVHAAVAGQNDGPHIAQNPQPLSRSQLRVLLHRASDFGGGEVLLRPECLGLNAAGRHTVFLQETTHPVYAPLRERLIKGRRTALVGMAFQNQFSVRLALQIFHEVAGQGEQRLLLAEHQATLGIRWRGLGGREIDAVQGEPAFQFLDLGRRWRRFNGHLGGGRTVQAARVGAGSADRDRSRGSAGGVQTGRVAAAGNGAAGGSPTGHAHLHVVRTLAVAADAGRSTRRHRSRAGGATHGGWILGRLLDHKAGGARGLVIALGFGVGHGGSGGVAPARQSVGVNGGGSVLAGDFAAGAGPVVIQAVLGIEVVGGKVHGDRFAHHDLGGLGRALRRRGCRRGASAQVEYQAAAQTSSAEIRPAQIQLAHRNQGAIVLACPLIVSFNQANAEVLGGAQVYAATQNCADAFPGGQRRGGQLIQAQ